MLRTSKRVYAEAAGILYGENTLYICRSPNSIKNLLQTIGPRNAGLIRRVAGFHWPYASFPSPPSLLAEEEGGRRFAGLTELEFREFTHLKFQDLGRLPLWWNSPMHISLRFDKVYVEQSRSEGPGWTKKVAEALPALLETRLRADFPRLRGVTLEHVAWPSWYADREEGRAFREGRLEWETEMEGVMRVAGWGLERKEGIKGTRVLQFKWKD
ncbi:hypothetical protein PG996_000546 [Apiospora saccharicola]|uniref:Uncharacterized protein n=1 Tax=Apiospora saccharicola TaxID=335842 RepID=A0ABR1WE51_9PEZI